MHYSPVLPAGGLLAAGQLLPSANPVMGAARLLLDLAGLFFLLLVLGMVVLNLLSAAGHAGRAMAALSRGGSGRHRIERSWNRR